MAVENVIGNGRIISTTISSRNSRVVRLKFENVFKRFVHPRNAPQETTAQAYADTVQKEAKSIIKEGAYFKGKLHNSIVIQTTPIGKNKTEYLVGVDMNILRSHNGFNYGGVIEHGSARHYAPLDSNPDLYDWIREKLGVEALERYSFIGFIPVQHEGIHFMERAYAKAFRVRKGRLRDAVVKSMIESGFKA